MNYSQQVTPKGTVKLLQYSAMHQQQLIISFYHIETYLTAPFVSLLIYIYIFFLFNILIITI